MSAHQIQAVVPKIGPEPDRLLEPGYCVGVLAHKKPGASDDPLEHAERWAIRAERNRLLDLVDAFLRTSEINQLGTPLRVPASKIAAVFERLGEGREGRSVLALCAMEEAFRIMTKVMIGLGSQRMLN